MNKSIDDRLLPNGEYRDAVNIQITKSDEDNVGTAHNIKGSTAVGGINLGSDYEVVGSFFDNQENRIFYFITNGTAHKIYVFYSSNGASSLLVNGDSFLNFSKDNLITGINLVDDLLYFTDNVNQPRRINVTKALASSSFYNSEAKISVAKYAPYYAPTMVISHDSSITSLYMKERFLRFAYRYKFEDNEYSIISPFTEIAFDMGTTSTRNNVMTSDELKSTYEDTTNSKVVNRVNKVVLTVPEPSANPTTDLQITHIEFLMKESNSAAVKILDSIAIDDTSWGSDQHVYTYRSELPTQTLSEEQVLRVFDDVPKKARSQEFIGNRLVYGDITKGFELPEIDYTPSIAQRVDDSTSSFNPQLSLKQRREYKVGVVLSDYYGRSTPVILSNTGNSTIESFAKSSGFDSENWLGDSLRVVFNENITAVTQATNGATTNNSSLTLASGGNLSSIKKGQRITGTGIVGLVEVKSISSTVVSLTSPQTIGDGVTLTFTNQTITNAYDATNNPLGFYSYKLVVQQKQQEYYNVYNPGVLKAYLTTEDYITLHGDNINKVPRDTTNFNENDNTSPSNVRLFPKVINQNSGLGTQGLIQSDGGLIRVNSIGTLSNQGFTNDGTVGDYTYKFYQHEKNHLIAQLDTNGGTIGVDAPEHFDQLAVFETEPFESVIDIFYETPTSGLVSDLNGTASEITIDTITLTPISPSVANSSTNISFFENSPINTDLLSIVAKDGTEIIPGAVITLQSATRNSQDVSSKFEVYFDNVDSIYKLRTKANFTRVTTTTSVTTGASTGTNNLTLTEANPLIQVGQLLSDSAGAVSSVSGTTIGRTGSATIADGTTLTFSGIDGSGFMEYELVFRASFSGTNVDSSTIEFEVENSTPNMVAVDDFSIIKTASDETAIANVSGNNGDAALTTQQTTFSIDSSRMKNGDSLDHSPLPFELGTFTDNSGVRLLQVHDSGDELGAYSGGEEIVINFKSTDNTAGTSIVTTQATAGSNAHTAGEPNITLSGSNTGIKVGQLVVGDKIPANIVVSDIDGTTLTVTGGTLSQQVANGTTLSFTNTESQAIATILASAAGFTSVTLNAGSTLSTYSSTAQACLGVTNGDFTTSLTVYHSGSNGAALSSALSIYKNENLSKLADSGWYSDGTRTGYWARSGTIPNVVGSWTVAPADCAT